VDTHRAPIQDVTNFTAAASSACVGTGNDGKAGTAVSGDGKVDSNSMSPDTRHSVTVREARFDDYAKIANLQARYELEAGSYQEWSHLWINNPVYRGREWWPIGWVLEAGDKEIVGYIGNIPLQYEFQGKTLLAATGRAFVVDAQHRSHSFQLLDRYFRQPKVDLHLNTTVNAQAISAYGIFRAVRVPVGEWDQSAFWITNHRGFVKSLLKSRSAPLAGLLSFPISLAPRIRELFSNKKLQADSSVTVEYKSHFDERFDAFWMELRKNNPRLLAVRDQETLEWHFRHALLRNRIWIMTIGSASRIEAYGIFFRDDNPKFDLKRMRLVDFQALNGGHHLLPSMLAQALQRCRDEGIHMLEVIGYCPEKREVVDAVIPYRRRLPSWMYFYRTKNRELAEVLKTAAVWDPSGFDGDSSF
jgi:hypothetical protein